MPIYEFRCDKCGHRFEKLCPMGETGENVKCPECDQVYPRKLVSGFAAPGAPRADGGDGADGGGGASCSGCSASSCAGCR
ncbi:MAG: zinc ribbon domain-containing protein [Eubacteriales bacterium]|nr:zinc ribbon domain-containing protein [Bacillota bacterium]MBV1726963.1 zinc ribbon domain-containing protein [Desulforudis sp.]MDP3050394.1 zinc ribbon domain-containing protein [Eubacteriales bacterium]MDQ7788788.1 zinc ribbon domain-containing protein [Clostridia bacterium]MBU4534007.1 zinc ribbon domain-containing protein [Bacillota bacterium]